MAEPVGAPSTRPVVYFHIGVPKTGTTFVQRILWDNQPRLSDLGVQYPGETFRAHIAAAFDLRQAGFRGFRDPAVPGSWAAFVAAAREWNGPTIFSQGLFCPATTDQIDRALDDLSFADVHLVCTVRELSRQVPASWQEDLKNRFAIGFDEFLVSLRDPTQDPHGVGRMFWRLQDAFAVLARWSRNVPSDRVHVITVPPDPTDLDLLWTRFASVVGVDPGAIELTTPMVNSSLDAAQAALLLRLNRAIDDEVGWPLYEEMVKGVIAHNLFADRKSTLRIELPSVHAQWVAERGAEIVAGIREAGYHVVGSLDELLPPPGGPGAQRQDQPSADEQAGLAVEAFAAILLRVSRLRRKVITP